MWFAFGASIRITLTRHSSRSGDIQHLEMWSWHLLELFICCRCWDYSPARMLRHKTTAGLEILEKKRGHFHSIKTAGYSWIYAVSIFCAYFSFFFLRFFISIKKCALFHPHFCKSISALTRLLHVDKNFVKKFRIWVIRAIFQNIAVFL